MPRLRSLAVRSARAELCSTPNPLTAQAWPSMMTGRSPGQHGVLDFVRFQERDGHIFLKLSDAHDLACETIWSIASRQERSVTALNFFGLWPAEPVNGYTMSGFVPWRHMKDAVYPPELYPQLKTLLNLNHKELAMDLDMEKKCIQGLPEAEYEDWVALHLRRERQWFASLRYLMINHPTDLTAIVFDGVDKLQHLCWSFLDENLFPSNPNPWESRIRALCLEYFRQLDELIGEAVALAGPEARVFFVSDHGFGATTEIVYINVWLHQQGLLTWANGASFDGEDRLGGNHLKDHINLLDLERTQAYALTPSSNGIFIRVAREDGRGGVPVEEYATFRDRLKTALSTLRDGHGQPVIVQVRTREEAYPGPQMAHAPDLLLTLRDQGFVSILNADAPVKPRPSPRGAHRPEGIFLACGPDVQPGEVAPLSILDIAPSLLYSLNLPIPEDFEGQPATHVFERSAVAATPPRTGEASRPPARSSAATAVRRRADEVVVLERLRALGYIE